MYVCMHACMYAYVCINYNILLLFVHLEQFKISQFVHLPVHTHHPAFLYYMIAASWGG